MDGYGAAHAKHATTVATFERILWQVIAFLFQTDFFFMNIWLT